MTDKIHIHVPKIEVKIPAVGDGVEQSFTVRGLNIVDLAELVNDYGPEMSFLYAKYTDGELALSAGKEKQALRLIMSKTPDFMGRVVEMVTENTVDKKTAMTLPISVQVDVLQAIGKTTFVGDDALGKLIGVVSEMMQGVEMTMAHLRNNPEQSSTGTGNIENQ